MSTRWSVRSVAILVASWVVLQLGGMFSPGLLDDVDSVYIEIAREMLHRHDYVTPYIDGIRFFDKPPLMYWMAAGAMKVFGEHDWAARMPLAVAALALLLAIYGLGTRLYGERGGFYAALAFGTAIGPYLYTRFFIPDIAICLWMTLGVWCFLVAVQAAATRQSVRDRAFVERADPAAKERETGYLLAVTSNSGISVPMRFAALLPMAGFSAALALNLLTKGLIGLVFPLGFVTIYLVWTRQLRLLRWMHPFVATLVFAAIALPWHVLAALRNPAIAMPRGMGLPARAGWAWFYLYNEHIARFLGRRIPQDYGNTPVWLFWLYCSIWMMPWGALLPGAIAGLRRRFDGVGAERTAALTVTIWAGLVMLFFSVSHRQEYYSLPALPALALLVGGFLALAEGDAGASRWARESHRLLLLPIACLVAVVCAFFALEAPRPRPGADLSSLLASNPAMYNLSLGHLFDLTGEAMGLFRGPLAMVALGMIALGAVSFALRRRGATYAANLTLAGGMTVVLLAAHEGLVRFHPILGSKGLAEAVLRVQREQPGAGDVIALDGELTSGSTLLFYTREPVRLVNGRVNGPWFGSFWPDAPQIFEDEASLRELWAGPARVFLMTYTPASREHDLEPFGKVTVVASAGGKTVLVNR